MPQVRGAVQGHDLEGPLEARPRATVEHRQVPAGGKPSQEALRRGLDGPERGPAVAAACALWVRRELIARSRLIRDGNFHEIETSDLALLFDLYDGRFFEGALGRALDAPGRLRFRLSSRMTSAAGKTLVLPPRPQRVYEIAVSTHLLFTNFDDPGRHVEVNGVLCRDRLEALQRIFEHELLHLAELLAFGSSSCRARGFRERAQRLFGHGDVTHRLVTVRERASEVHGLCPGDRVAFTFGGVCRQGRINRITKRATVLVEHGGGTPYSDGRRYLAFYVPLSELTPVKARRAGDP